MRKLSLMYNEMGQRIKYKGQVSVGDKIHFISSGHIIYKVINLKDDIGIIERYKDTWDIDFVEGKGWGWWSFLGESYDIRIV